MGLRTVLFPEHQKAGARIIDFGGWEMPLHYGSQIEEHDAVRNNAGVFDVSHMTVVDVIGVDAKSYLRHLLANDVEKLNELGKALYSAMLNHQGKVIDDLIVYLTAHGYRLVVNCATREKDLQWMQDQAVEFDVELHERDGCAMLAVQGPEAIDRVKSIVSPAKADLIARLKLFQGMQADGWFIARTGYTGEKGLEIVLPNEDATAFWTDLLAAGVKPIGLGARDTLRLEAGMNLYGNDMDETISPLESNMEVTIAWQPETRHFIGRQALTQERDRGVQKEQVGLVMESRGVMRSHQNVFHDDNMIGEVTSGAYSPTLGFSIALALIEKSAVKELQVEIRNKLRRVQVVTTPFVRNGKKVYKDRTAD
jgi:aminomethyltransferase